MVLALVLAIAGVVYWWSERESGEPLAIPEDAYPPGRWSRAPVLATSDRATEEGESLARVLSLPYLEGKVEAGEASGVMLHDTDRAYPGLNLYCSGHAPEAILMDMEGRVLHRWRMRFREAFPNQETIQESAFFRRVALLPDGALLALFHGTGLIKIDRDSNLLWARPLAGFNDFFVEEDGRILLLGKQGRIIPEINPDAPVLEDSIVELTPEGERIGSASLLAAFREPPWNELLATMGSSGDILHSNTVTRLAPGSSFPAGSLLVSLREVDVIGVLDPSGAEVLWGRRGDWRRQHEPVLLESGRILLFDNKGGPGGGTRVVEIERGTGEVLWTYGEDDGEAIFSPEGGTVARLGNGNTLITASESGRVIEIDPDGTVVWEFWSPHRAGQKDELVAAIWEVQRLDPASVPWLGAS